MPFFQHKDTKKKFQVCNENLKKNEPEAFEKENFTS